MQSPFDILAETYDADFTQTSIGQLQRMQVWNFLAPVLYSFSKPLKILEINCGTGDDALRLAALGHTVIATDASPQMIEKAKQKMLLQNAHNNIQFEVCRFEELNQRFNGEKFDLVFSNFGGLNCIDENEIKRLGRELSSIMSSHGKLFFVLMSRYCIWEILYFSLKGKLKTAFRRQKKLTSFKVGETTMPIFYYSPGKLKKLFNTFYRFEQAKPVGLFIPPSYLEKQFSVRQHWLNRLNRWEIKWNKHQALSNLADHFCITFQKKEL